jgi:glycosyltransferase involved in cell wall biosynthesis
MPTYNRRAFVPHAIRYFLRQDYPNKELIIIDDGTDSIEDIVSGIPGIRYYRLRQKITIGAKLNMACEYAKGNIIANWNDDDWYAPRRLQYQVDTLNQYDIDICGINQLLYYDLRNKKAFCYIYPKDQRVWLAGSSLCYTKQLWEKKGYAEVNIGEDGLFVWAADGNRIKVLPDATISVHMIHDANVCPKKTNGGWWHPHSADEIMKIMDSDWCYYNQDSLVAI